MLSIIIVSWNVKEKLRENLKSIYYSIDKEQKPFLDFEIFVVDNDSKDGTAEMVKNEFQQVKLIANRQNLGFSKANNQALRLCSSDHILLLNPDMKVFPDTLYNMIRWMKNNPQASVAGCKLLDERGDIIKHVRRFPAFFDQLAIVLKLPHLAPKILNKYLRNDFDYSREAKVDSVRGGFFMIRKEMIEKIGLLDERFFVWFEEVDYCKRAAISGAQVWYTPDASCIDYVGQSFSQVKRGTTQRYFQGSMLKYFKKWHPKWQYYLLKIAWPIGKSIACLGEAIRYKSSAKT